MYTRTYSEDDGKLNIPDGYDGTAFAKKESEPPPSRPIIPNVSEPKCSPRESFPELNVPDKEAEHVSDPYGAKDGESILSVFKRLPFGKFFGERGRELFHFDKFKVGSEELLIIGVALFLLFSKEGDKDCAIALLILLFVN